MLLIQKMRQSKELPWINGLSSLAGEGMTMSAKANGKNVTMTMTMDVTKMSESDLENNLGTKELSKDAFVKAMGTKV